ncbi:tripartite tricarboxylate transporter permease [Afifella pfennigii]|uniref:tripartite tricarboxylate transporter permease n=1 Tax=Afifella pfennigii TaxID=209897 RepID=UPI00047BC84E|nr:tripartite tricarboxylate transporter permease [Afifella pfennigii]
MLESLLTAIAVVFSWPNLAFLFLGTLFGFIVGVLPGLGGAVALALLIPISFGFEVYPAIILLISAMGGVEFGGAISAILFNAPGGPTNLATSIDGYPAAKAGRAGEAIGAAAVACVFGALFGVGVVILLMPVLRNLVLAFGPPELFWLAIFGLTLIAVVSGRSMTAGLLAASFGVLLSFIGLNPITGGYRFTFGSTYLWDGLPLVAVVLGLFAVAELMNVTIHRRTIAEGAAATEMKGGVLRGMAFCLRRWFLCLRSSVIGVLIGAIPGVGGSVSVFVAYAHAKNTSKHPETFGTGNLEGVVAPESNNDAKDGGSLIPLFGLGIPGSVSTAVLLGGLTIHGLNVGPGFLRDHLDIAYLIVIALACSNVITAAIGLSIARGLARLTRVPIGALAPVLITLCMIGAYSLRFNIYDVLLTVGFGFVGLLMIKADFPRLPLILALILAPMAERNLHIAMQISEWDASILFLRPISALLVFLTLWSVLFAPTMKYVRRRSMRANQIGKTAA